MHIVVRAVTSGLICGLCAVGLRAEFGFGHCAAILAIVPLAVVIGLVKLA